MKKLIASLLAVSTVLSMAVFQPIEYGENSSAGGIGLQANAYNIYYGQYTSAQIAYADQKIDEYIAANIKSNMSDYEKVLAAAKMAASYDYSFDHSDYIGMINYGGGDCYASTTLILKICEKIGLEGWVRNGNRDEWAAASHWNPIIKGKDGKYYIPEAGWYGTAPRSCFVMTHSTLYSTRSAKNGNGLEVYQYDGETMAETLDIPATIDGQKVVGLCDEFALRPFDGRITQQEHIKKVNLPTYLEYIGSSAFQGCAALGTVNFNKNLTEIGSNAFNECYNLLAINLPESVKTIGDYAFVGCSKVKSVTVSKNTTSIGAYALGFTYNYNTNNFEKISGFTLYCYKGSAAETYAKKYGVNYSLLQEAVPEILGDVDNDGLCSYADVAMITSYVATDVTFSDAQKKAADLDGNGSINYTDVAALISKIVD